MTVTVSVTAKDIKRGVRVSCTACPIALAAKRAFALKRNQRVEVGGASLWLIDRNNTRMRTYRLPLRASEFIRKFDGRSPVKPIKFAIRFRKTADAR